MVFVLIAILSILFETYYSLEVNVPRPDQIALGHGETKLIYLNDFLIGENLTIRINSISPDTNLVNLPASPQAIEMVYSVPYLFTLNQFVLDSERYAYGVSQQNIFYLYDKENGTGFMNLLLNSCLLTAETCFGMVEVPPSTFIIDCNLLNGTQAFFIVFLQTNSLTCSKVTISPSPFKQSCSRTLANSVNYIFQYCPCPAQGSSFAQIFGYADMNISFITVLNKTSLQLNNTLCIKTITDVPQHYNSDQFLLLDNNNGVIAFDISKQGSNVAFVKGNPLPLQTASLKYLAKRKEENFKYDLESDTHFLIVSDNFVYEISVKELEFSIVHHYLFKKSITIIEATLTQDYAAFAVDDSGDFYVQAIQRKTSILASIIPLKNSNSMISSAQARLNTIYLFEQNGFYWQVAQVQFTENLIELSCCNNVTNLTFLSLDLTACELDQGRCSDEKIGFYVFPLDYSDPIPVQTDKLSFHSQKFSINLEDIFSGPVPYIVQPNLTIPGEKGVDLMEVIPINQSIVGSLPLPLVIHDLITNMLFTDIYWTTEGESFNIVNHHITQDGSRQLNVLQCQVADDVTCSYYKSQLDDHDQRVIQAIYSQQQLYMLLDGPALIFIFGESFTPVNNSAFNCNSISVNTGASGNILCFSDQQICIFQQKTFLGCPFQAQFNISQVNDRYLDQQILFISNQTHVTRLKTTNSTQFELIDVFQVCHLTSSACDFQIYFWGKLTKMRMVIVNITNNCINEYDISKAYQPMFLRNYPLYGATISTNQSIYKSTTDFIPLVVDNFQYNGTKNRALFIYNPEHETNKVLVNVIPSLDPETFYFYTSGKIFETVVGLNGVNPLLYNFYKAPKVDINLTLDGQELQEDVQTTVTLQYSNIFSTSSFSKEFPVDCDFSNFFISNCTGMKLPVDLRYGDGSFRPPCAGPISGFTLECDSSVSVCPYYLTPFFKKYFFFANYYQTYTTYGYPVKMKNLDEFVVLLSQKTLTLAKLGDGSEQSMSINITPFGLCSDLIVENSTFYLLCQSRFQTFYLYVKPFEGFDKMDANFIAVQIRVQFQEIRKIRIVNDFVFVLGNSTETFCVNDISIYKLTYSNQNTATLIRLKDFTNLFSGFATFDIEGFNPVFIGNFSSGTNDSYTEIYGIFVIYTGDIFYAEINFTTYSNGTVEPFPNLLVNTNLTSQYDNIHERGSFIYIKPESFTYTVNSTATFYQFNLLVGTIYNMYLLDVSFDSIHLQANYSINGILKGYSDCLNYYTDDPKISYGLRANLCYNINQNVTSGTLNRVYTVLVYNLLFNNITLNVSNVLTNVSFPLTMITMSVPANSSSFFIYQTQDSGEMINHIVTTHSLFQFEDYLIYEKLLIKRDPALPPINMEVNLTTFNAFVKQNTIIAVTANPGEPEALISGFYFLIFGLSILVMGAYFIMKKFKRKTIILKVRQQEESDEDDDDEFSVIARTKSLMQ